MAPAAAANDADEARRNGVAALRLRSAWTFAACAAVVLWGHLSFSAFLALVLVLVLGFVAALRTLVCALVLPFRRGLAQRLRFANALLDLIACALALAGVVHGKAHLQRVLEKKLAPAIAALEGYRRAHAAYPQGLQEAMREPPICPDGTSPYTRTRDGYCLTCVTVGLEKHSYCSDDPRWRSWD